MIDWFHLTVAASAGLVMYCGHLVRRLMQWRCQCSTNQKSAAAFLHPIPFCARIPVKIAPCIVHITSILQVGCAIAGCLCLGRVGRLR